MPNSIYQQFQPTNNNLINQIAEFKKTINGNPQQIIQQMLNNGRISQQQINQYAQQANELYKQLKGVI